MGIPLPHQTMQSKAIQFYEFQLPLRKSPMTQKVLNFLARSLVLAIGLGNMSVTSEKEVIQQPTWLLHRERAPESPQSRWGGTEESHPVGTYSWHASTDPPFSAQADPKAHLLKEMSFLHEVLRATMPPKSSHQLCSPYFGRAYGELTSSYVRYVIPEIIDHFPH